MKCVVCNKEREDFEMVIKKEEMKICQLCAVNMDDSQAEEMTKLEKELVLHIYDKVTDKTNNINVAQAMFSAIASKLMTSAILLKTEKNKSIDPHEYALLLLNKFKTIVLDDVTRMVD